MEEKMNYKIAYDVMKERVEKEVRFYRIVIIILLAMIFSVLIYSMIPETETTETTKETTSTVDQQVEGDNNSVEGVIN